jgi:hypothetical protein
MLSKEIAKTLYSCKIGIYNTNDKIYYEMYIKWMAKSYKVG